LTLWGEAVEDSSALNKMALKEKIADFVELAKQCPEKLQETCFRVLLENHLSGHKPDLADEKKDVTATSPTEKLEKAAQQQGDIQEKDIHVKVKRFMDKNSVSLEDLNLVFYKEGEAFLPLFDSLGTTKTSESQIRVALLRCLRSALDTGEFEVPLEDVRAECQQRKCYDVNNWRNNFVNNARLFTEKFTKDVKTLKLSDEGKKELAEVVKQLK
jgi:hypothetical protein